MLRSSHILHYRECKKILHHPHKGILFSHIKECYNVDEPYAKRRKTDTNARMWMKTLFSVEGNRHREYISFHLSELSRTGRSTETN